MLLFLVRLHEGYFHPSIWFYILIYELFSIHSILME